MPFYKSRRPRFTRRRRFARRNPPGLATRPRMMGRRTFQTRKYGVDTKTFWFKQNGIITTNVTADQYVPWMTSDLAALGGPAPFGTVKRLYDQYKILGMKVKIFPANPGVDDFLPLRRGNVVMWADTRFDPTVPVPTVIGEVIGNNNCRMVQPNRRMTMSLYRPRGKPTWGSCKTSATAGDLWIGEINMLINDATITPAPPATPTQMWFWSCQWKVIFRGRVDD